MPRPYDECRNLHVVGVRRGHDGVGTDLAAIELQAPRIGVVHGLEVLPGVRPLVEHRLRFGAAAGTTERHPQPVG